MEQIFYTQCPTGYGLGATNGFQVKRRSAGYATADIRHLGMRAFLPGTRTVAPGALRYRLDGDIAEIAWLTPREHEYVTEKGPWGRPGGLFAHGLRLDRDELARIRNWPAGLLGAPFWVHEDPVPTLRLPPEEQVPPVFTIEPSHLMTPPEWPAVAARERPWPDDLLARLLTALARVTREHRTLFVIDQADRLGPLFALLTFVFPEPLRRDLTFSTYHDRPEELSGFRLLGTVHEARPNRAVLGGLGLIADLKTGTFEPRIEPAAWAETLVGWLARPDAGALAAWTETTRRAALALSKAAADAVWSDEGLDHLIGFPERTRPGVLPPASAEGWDALKAASAWSYRHGLADDWTEARGPEWWSAAAGHAATYEARRALLSFLRHPAAWKGRGPGQDEIARAARWGEIVAAWFRDRPDEERHRVAFALLTEAAPKPARGSFLACLARTLPPAAADALIDDLRSRDRLDPSLLLPIQASRLAALATTGGEQRALHALLVEALQRPGVIASVLEAVAVEADAQRDRVPAFARTLAEVLEQGREAPGWPPAWRWALARADRLDWLGPYLLRFFAPPQDRAGYVRGPADWQALIEGTPEPLRPALAQLVLTVARDDRVARGVFTWAVDALLLPIDPPPRGDPAWPDEYLDRAAGLDLVRWLHQKSTHRPELDRWLRSARKKGRIAGRNLEKLEAAERYARTLRATDPRELAQLALPDVPPARRGELLGHALQHLKLPPFQAIGLVLDACRRAWPGGFHPQAPGLDALAEALAGHLADERAHPERWLVRLEAILDRLGPEALAVDPFDPEGFAAHVVRAASRRDGEPRPAVWAFRRFLFRHDQAWRALALDVRADLEDDRRAALVASLERWDEGLVRGQNRLETRFHELIVNACPTPRALARAVEHRSAALRTLGRIPWWGLLGRLPDLRDDLRDAFARLAPMEPLDWETFPTVAGWMRHADSLAAPEFDLDGLDLGPAVTPAARPRDPAASYPHLSPAAVARWRCLEALTTFSRPNLAPLARWQSVRQWIAEDLPLGAVDLDDRHRFTAVVIAGLDEFDPNDFRTTVPTVNALAGWLSGPVGLRDFNRVADWQREFTEVTESHVRARLPLVRALHEALRGET